MDNKSLHEQGTWNDRYAAVDFRLPPRSNQIRRFIERHVSRERSASGRSALEIGCFPGGYLALMGERGYLLNGFDLCPRLPELRSWLASRNYRIGKLAQEDFFAADARAYQSDLVFSNGFIEHFENWAEVLTRHADFVRPGGRLLVTAPNFAGTVQRLLHEKLDVENLKRHYLPSMNPDAWAMMLRRAGMNVVWQGYFGGFNFWVEEMERSRLQRSLVRVLRVARLPLRIAPNHRWYSPYCGIVAERPVNAGDQVGSSAAAAP